MSSKRKLLYLLLISALSGILYYKFIHLHSEPKLDMGQVLCYDENGSAIPTKTGKPSIVSYYQTWCSDCRRETPLLDSFCKAHNIALYNITDEPLEKVAQYKKLFPDVQSFYYARVYTLKEIGIRKYPTVYFFDKDGKQIMVKLESVETKDLDQFLTIIQK